MSFGIQLKHGSLINFFSNNHHLTFMKFLRLGLVTETKYLLAIIQQIMIQLIKQLDTNLR